MNIKSFVKLMAIAFIGFTTVLSCTKDDSQKEYGMSMIYMPQAIVKSGGVNANYTVPSGMDSTTFNYTVDRSAGIVSVIMGVSLSGPGKGAYSVDIAADNDTLQKMFAAKVFDTALYKAMPTTLYAMPTSIDVADGERSGTFDLRLNIQALKNPAFSGKFLVLPVRIKPSSKSATTYPINNALATTVVIIDVNTLVIGPSVNVTSTYLKNAGNPFTTSGRLPSNSRWGTLANWSTNPAVRNHDGYGGWTSDNSGMNMESGWGSAQILNGKIYQTVTTLPAGFYRFDASGGNWSGGENFMKENGYMVVAPMMDSLPNYNNIVGNSAVYSQVFNPSTKSNQPVISFRLDAPSTVTFGVVINYSQMEQGFKSKQVILLNYPKAL